MKKSDTKQRILCVERIFTSRKAVSMGAILKELEAEGVSADRRAVYDDINALTRVYNIDYDHKTRKWILNEKS